MVLVDNDQIISDDKEIATTMNNYFSTITKSLDIIKWPDPGHSTDNMDHIMMAIRKYENHSSILKIKSHYKSETRFKFKNITPDSVKEKVKSLSTGKSSRGDIPTSILK